jgi:hypothetical protein
MAPRGLKRTRKRTISKRGKGGRTKRARRTIRKRRSRMRGGIGVKGAVKTAFQTATSSSPDTWQQTKTIVGSPWVNIAKGKDCSFTNNCNIGVITTPMSVVDRAYRNLAPNLRSLPAIDADKSLTPSLRQTDKNILLGDTAKLDGFLKS